MQVSMCQGSKCILFSAFVAIVASYVSGSSSLHVIHDAAGGHIALVQRQASYKNLNGKNRDKNQTNTSQSAEQDVSLGEAPSNANQDPWVSWVHETVKNGTNPEGPTDIIVNGNQVNQSNASQEAKLDGEMITQELSLDTAQQNGSQENKQDQDKAQQNVSQDNAQPDASKDTRKHLRMMKKGALKVGVAIENLAGKYLNVEGNRKRNGSLIWLWDYQNLTSAVTRWRVQHFVARPGTYTIESARALGMYLTVGDNETSFQLRSNATSNDALWRIQIVAGNVEAYTFESVNAPGKYLMGADTNESSRGANVSLGDNLSSITAQWTIHAPYKLNFSSPNTTNTSHTLHGIWRNVHGCFDLENGSKIHKLSCEPTPSPTPLPTKTPTSSPTPRPTVRSHWAIKMNCMDAHGNKLDPKNCAPITNGHAIESQHVKSR